MKRLLLLSLFLSACADQDKLPPEVRGKGAYAAYDCKRCHRIGEEGGDAGPDLSYAGFRKSAEFMELWLKDPKAWQPQTLMPNFQMTERGRKDIAAYLATLKGQDYKQKPWDKDPAKKGELLYKHLGCVTCHGVGGKGGLPNNNVVGGKVPGLDKVAEGFSKAELIEKIAKGVPHPARAVPSDPPPYLHMPAWGEILTAQEIEALADTLLKWSSAKGGSESW